MESLLLRSHRPKNIALVLLSLFFLPLSTTILALSYILRALYHPKKVPTTNNAPKKTILVTGVSMSKGLALARAFHLSNPAHRVIGADFSPLACGRVSVALSAFHVLSAPDAEKDDPSPYISSLLHVIETEGVDLWVSCSGVASAVEDGVAKEIVEARTRCKAVQFGVEDTRVLHEKDRFVERVREVGLLVPETRRVEGHEEMLAALGVGKKLGDGEKSVQVHKIQGKQFIAKCVGVDDKSRADMTLLPRPTPAETRSHVSRLSISPHNPWILQEYIRGPEFCTHSLVIDGEVKVFVACPSAELLMHYEALPATCPLSAAMLRFTQTVARASGKGFTGHLSFDFLVPEEDVGLSDPAAIRLYPIECNPRAHTAVVLFTGTSATEMARRYLELLAPPRRRDSAMLVPGGSIGSHLTHPHPPVHHSHSHTKTETPPTTPSNPPRLYWAPHDLLTLLLLPALHFLTHPSPGNLGSALSDASRLAEHVLWWRDGAWVVWDPLPAWWLYHVFWPAVWAGRVGMGRHGAWSRVNVSTGKVFGVGAGAG